uniref:Uncharacterized protein n=1 Tax=Panagrolaimus sp. ES5 TaxID=591445 RepID=A0AC34GQ47_9BILA
MFIVCTIECYPTVFISPYERHPLQIPYSQTSATTYRLSIPDVPSGYVASENRRKRRQISSSSSSVSAFGDESVDDTLARLDLICNKLKKRSTTSSHSSGGRRSRDTEQLLSFLCKSMIIDDPDLI